MKHKFILLAFSFLLTTLTYLLSSSSVLAQDFHTDYKVEYFLSTKQNRLNTRARFSIKITNLRADLYVKEFSISFPQTFITRDIRAYDDHVEIIPQISSNKLSTQVKLAFSDPAVGRNSVNNFYLEYYQDNLFTVSGNIWEVIIPTVADKKDSSYKIIVHLPANSEKKISLAKPKPTQITGNDIIWDNPAEKTIYATFGDVQYYQNSLTYHLANTRLIPVYTDIAFPPDTLYQKVYIQSVDPKPEQINIDVDGNYLGRYYLKPKENKTVNFKGVIAVYSQLRQELLPFTKNSLPKQSQYLLSQPKFWKINDISRIDSVPGSPADIYAFVTRTLQYDFAKVNSNNIRLGADAVLSKTNQAVCMEFTDLFVAIAREKSIYAREIEGYGFSQDSKLRPLSLASDILHAWPEYFDQRLGYWLPVDPTWENTSGIDYFSDFDLNHIVFAIHGKDPDYPPPAGTYKSENSHDVAVSATSELPKEVLLLGVVHDPSPSIINDSQIYTYKISITNNGNTYLWNKPINLTSKGLAISPSVLFLDPLAPYQTATFSFTYKALQKNRQTKGEFTVRLPDNSDIRVNVSIVPFYYQISLIISAVLFIILVIATLIILRRRLKQR